MRLSDKDFDAARIESSSVLHINTFVPADAIESCHHDFSSYVTPDGDAGEDVYAVRREAIERSVRVALSCTVIAWRERAMAIMARGRGQVAHTLHKARDLRDPQSVFADLPADRPEPE